MGRFNAVAQQPCVLAYVHSVHYVCIVFEGVSKRELSGTKQTPSLPVTVNMSCVDVESNQTMTENHTVTTLSVGDE